MPLDVRKWEITSHTAQYVCPFKCVRVHGGIFQGERNKQLEEAAAGHKSHSVALKRECFGYSFARYVFASGPALSVLH